MSVKVTTCQTVVTIAAPAAAGWGISACLQSLFEDDVA